MIGKDSDARLFFPLVNFTVLWLVVFGFGRSFFWRDAGVLGAQPDVLITHGLVFTLWYILIFVQSLLATLRAYGLHKILGYSSLLLSMAMVWTGLQAAAYAYRVGTTAGPLDQAGFQFLPFSDLLVFIILFGLGLYNRENGAAHKRYMTLASISMLLPAVGRLAETLGLPGESGAGCLLMLALSIAGHDWLKHRKIRSATGIGLSAIVLKLSITLPFGQSKTWALLIKQFYGAILIG